MADKLRFAVTGATGLVGRKLCAMLAQQGHTVWGLKRATVANVRGTASQPLHATWNVETGQILTPEPADVIVHLAGRNVAARWSQRVQREVWDSRVPATEKLCGHLAQLPANHRPRALIAASAIGIYGDRGEEVLTEDSAVAEKGRWFLADVCRAWEAATRPAEDAGIRVVHLRISVVLAREGGALAKMAGPVKWGLGGPVGSGMQWMPWISSTDVCRLILAAAQDEQARGPINAATNTPVRQHEFMRVLGKVLHRPTIFPLPGFMVKLAFGQMGREVLLGSSRVIGTKLPAGFTFGQPSLEQVMRAEFSA